MFGTVISHRQSFSQLIRFCITGGFASGVHLFLLYVLTDYLGMWYLMATTLGFLIAFSFSFALQKYWTFQNYDKARTASQAGGFFVLQGINLILNGVGMYLFVDVFGVSAVVAQVLVLAMLAFGTFVISKRFIFLSQQENHE